jgi:Bacterial Ig-like domain (group 3)
MRILACKIRLIAALGLLISGLVLVGGTGVAHASTAPGNTISTAGTLSIGDTASGGGGPIDFWKVHLNGGDVVQFAADYPTGNTYTFALYAPGTNDTNFSSAASFSQVSVYYGYSKEVFDLQAPYNSTFILAVCENVSNNTCANVYASGSGTHPMGAYTFTTSFVNGGIPNPVAAKETRAASTIAGAPTLGTGHLEAGGANPIDFWKMPLRGGDVVQIATNYPSGNTYTFALYAPGTNDTTFASAASFSQVSVYYGYSKEVFDLQAPYNGTFILAVCENVSNYTCANVYASGSGTNPMYPYTFTPTLVQGGVSATVAAQETKASPMISGAPELGAGHFEAGGANPIDFWKMPLNGGDQVQFTADYPLGNTYTFALYKPGTSDVNFASAVALSQVSVYYGYSKEVFDLQAPYNGTFILAVCENVSNNTCANVYASGSGTNPMYPYTFTTKQTGGHETRTSLKLSAVTVVYGHEKALKFSVAVGAVYGGRPTGKVSVSDGKKTVCVVKLVNGKGTCSPAANTAIPVGKYAVTAAYAGNLYGSRSAAVTLTIKK